MIIKRICIRSEEVAEILGIGQKQAQRKLKLMKDAFGKRKDQYITFKEFADYTAIPLEDLMAACFPAKSEK